MAESSFRGRRAVALAVVAGVAVAGLGSPGPGTHPDEALYLALGAEMHQQNAWLTPTLEGIPDFTKPPLLYWLMRLCFALFGVQLWAARLPVALSTLGLAWMAGQVARPTVGERSAPLAILLTGTSLGILRYGRLDMMDVPLALAVAVGLWMAWTVAEGASAARLLLAGVAGGAAALLKGPVGPLLLALVGGWWFARRRPGVFGSPWLPASVGLGLALAGPWYLAMAEVHGPPFLQRFFEVENLGKFQMPWTTAGELLLLASLPVLFLPWTPLALGGGGAGKPLALAWPWVLAVLVVYSLPGLKHPHYVVPAILPLAVLSSGEPGSGGRWATAGLLGALAAVGALALRFPLEDGVRLALGAAVLLMGGGAVLVARARPFAAAVAVAGGAVLLVGAVLPGAVPAPIPPQAWTEAGARPVFTVEENPGLLTVLSGRTVHRAYGEAGVRSALDGGGALVLSESERERLPEDIRYRLVPLLSWSRLQNRVAVSSLVQAWLRADLRPVLETTLLAIAPPGSLRLTQQGSGRYCPRPSPVLELVDSWSRTFSSLPNR